MNAIKKKFALTTDQGEDKKSALWLAMSAIYLMPDSIEKHILIGVWLLAMVAISYLTIGHKADREFVDLEKDLKDVLGEGEKK
jgi:hypothetical protein